MTLRLGGLVVWASMALVLAATVPRAGRGRTLAAALGALGCVGVLGASVLGRVAWEHGARRAAYLAGVSVGRWADRGAESLAAAALVGVAAALVALEGTAEGRRAARGCGAVAAVLALAAGMAGG